LFERFQTKTSRASRARERALPGQVELSILVVNYDTVDLLRSCLESIHRHPPSVSFEVLVVDNASPDGSVSMVREEFPGVRLMILPENVGFARANNAALAEAVGRRLLLLNSDTLILDGSLDGLLEAMERHPGAGVVGCKQLDGNGQLQLTWGRFPSFYREIVRKVLHWRLRIDGSQIREYLESKYASSSQVDWVSGSCLLIRREAIDQGGLLDENIFLYFEDIDWCRRIQDEGWEILYEPRVKIIHYGGATAARHLIDALVAYRQSQLYFCRKYFGRSAAALLKTLVGIKSALAFVRTSFAWVAATGRPEAQFRAYCTLLTLKKILQSLWHRVPRPVAAPRASAPPLPMLDHPGMDVREAS
jgi:GT2 family glycosyltransferase